MSVGHSAAVCDALGHDWSYLARSDDPDLHRRFDAFGAAHARERLDCEAVGLLRCRCCAAMMPIRCGTTRASKCAGCAGRHRRRLVLVGVHGVIEALRSEGLEEDAIGQMLTGSLDVPGFSFVTLTAPGADVLPWDVSRCSHPVGVACSGKHFGCTVDARLASQWNGDIKKANSYVRQYLIRELRKEGVSLSAARRCIFMGTWELQKRGLLHRHSIWAHPGISKATFHRCMARAAGALGWSSHRKGCDVRELRALLDVGYCAKYAAKSSDDLVGLPLTDDGEVMPGRIRPWSRSTAWPMSMGLVKQRQRLWAAANAGTAEHEGRDRADSGEAGEPGAAGVLGPNTKLSTPSVLHDPLPGFGVPLVSA